MFRNLCITATHFHRRSQFPDFPEVEKHRMNLQTNKQTKTPHYGLVCTWIAKINRDSTYLLHFMLLQKLAPNYLFDVTYLKLILDWSVFSMGF